MRIIKDFIKRLALSKGYWIEKVPTVMYRGDMAYQKFFPTGTYAPWNSDKEFISICELIKDHTLNDVYRLWGVWTLVQQSAKLSGALIEIGVWRGGSGALIAHKARLCRIESPVYLCDTFKGVIKAGSQDSIYRGGEHADTSREVVEQLLKKLDLSNAQILEGAFPEASSKLLETQKVQFRFCHIDVDVYQSAKDIVDWIWSRMVPGGIIVFDDYGQHACEGVTRYVNEQMNKDDRLIIHNLDGHAVVIKIKGL